RATRTDRAHPTRRNDGPGSREPERRLIRARVRRRWPADGQRFFHGLRLFALGYESPRVGAGQHHNGDRGVKEPADPVATNPVCVSQAFDLPRIKPLRRLTIFHRTVQPIAIAAPTAIDEKT